MFRKKPYIILLLIFIAFACSKEAIEVFYGFRSPGHFPPPVYPIENNRVTKAGFELGKMLFSDTMLSVDNSMSCASCHMQSAGFTHHGHDLSHGLNGSFTKRNTTPIMNLAWMPSFMWDGSVNHLDRQPIRPLTSMFEMGETIPHILKKLNSSPVYRTMFSDAVGSTVATEEKMLKALSQFMVMCVSDNAKYDSVRRGETVFSAEEKEGYAVFLLKCNACHSEPLFTDFSFRNAGLEPYFRMVDSGRYVATRNLNDFYKFKVPSLRNLGYTAPYMHDGRFSTLEKVFNHYDNKMMEMPNLDPLFRQNGRIGIPLTANERTKLTAFLKTLDDHAFIKSKLLEHKMTH